MMPRELDALARKMLVLDLIKEFSSPKTVGTVATTCGLTERSVHRYIKALKDFGFTFDRVKIISGVRYQITQWPAAFNKPQQ